MGIVVEHGMFLEVHKYGAQSICNNASLVRVIV